MDEKVAILMFSLFAHVVCITVIQLRSKMVLGKKDTSAQKFFFASAFLSPILLLFVPFFDKGIVPSVLAAVILLGSHALIFIRQESQLPALKKKQVEQQAELERRVAERQQQQDEAKKTKEELITKWLDKEGRNDDSPKVEQQVESERRAAEWQQQQDETKKKNERLTRGW